MEPLGLPMPVNTNHLQDKLRQLDEYIQDVVALRTEPKEEFARKKRTGAAAERMLERAMQCTIDIAGYIVAEEALGNATQYKDLFMYLGRAGIISPDLTDRLEQMAGFRNVLIHQYAQVQPDRVYRAVQSDVDDLVAFAQTVTAKYLPSGT